MYDGVRPDEYVELFTLGLHVVLLLVQLVLQPGVDLRQFITAQFLRLSLKKNRPVIYSLSILKYLNSEKQQTFLTTEKEGRYSLRKQLGFGSCPKHREAAPPVTASTDGAS